jgi:hypothetical protein
MKLNPAHRTNPVWLAIKEQAIAEREELRVQNDQDLSPEKTQHVRGRIYQLTALIESDQPQLPVPDARGD